MSDVIFFPDDPRPAHWRRPVVALGNFDGLHRGHQKIVERVCRQAREHGATPVVMTFDPHPPRVVRPDKAPPLLMTNAQRIEALRKAGIEGVAIVRFTHEMSRWEPEQFVRDRAGRVAARRRSVGRRQLPVRPRSLRQLLAAALARRALRLPRRARSTRSATATSSSAARASAGWSPRAGSTRRARCSGTTTSSTAGRGRAPAAAGRSASRPPTSRPRTSCCRRTASTRPTVTIDGTVHRSITNIGVRPTFETGGAPTIETHVFGLDRDLYGRDLRLVVRAADAGRAGLSGRRRRWSRRSTPTAPRRRRSVRLRPSSRPETWRGSGLVALIRIARMSGTSQGFGRARRLHRVGGRGSASRRHRPRADRARPPRLSGCSRGRRRAAWPTRRV